MKLFKCKIEDLAKLHLVEFRPQLIEIYKRSQKVVFITVSPNPKRRHKFLRSDKKINVSYQNMTHEEQYDYLTEYIRYVYANIMEHKDWIYIAYEVNKDNNLHAHMLLFSESIQTDYDIKALQKTAYAHPMTVYNRCNNKDYMNNIVFLDEDKIDEIIDYFNKDVSIKVRFPDQYIEK